MEARDNNSGNKNKGFTIYVGDTLVGFLNIWEKNVPANTVNALQDPVNMKAILDNPACELRAYADKPMVDTSGIDSIIADAQTAKATETIVAGTAGTDDSDDADSVEASSEQSQAQA